MAVKPQRVAEAISQLQQAIDYWSGPAKGVQGSSDHLVGLIGEMLDDELEGGRYADATGFAEKELPLDPSYQRIVGPKIRDKIDMLIKDNKAADAQTLIDAALKMQPALDDRYIQQIKTIQAELKKNGQ